MNIAILGRQPELGALEMERLFGIQNINWCGNQSLRVNAKLDVQKYGGVKKTGLIKKELHTTNFKDVSRFLVGEYKNQLINSDVKKYTLGISVYDFDINPKEVQKIGLILKSQLRKKGKNLRLIPNSDIELNTATSHHNKLGLSANKIEILIIKDKNKVVIAESTGAQNISALVKRDQKRPKRDAFVGMLPPKLALMLINYSGDNSGQNLLDPFCGTGVIMQEAMLAGYHVFGTDLSDKMIEYSKDNLAWLKSTHSIDTDLTTNLNQGDATTHNWGKKLDNVVCETYLGQPFSAPPSPKKLEEVVGNCNKIISNFLKNIVQQIDDDTNLVIAVPAWKSKNGDFTTLPLTENLSKLGFWQYNPKIINLKKIMYYREDQVVARHILILKKKQLNH